MTRPIRSALAALMLLGAGTSPLAQAAGVLRIAVNPIYPPLEFRDPVTDALTGFDIDFGNALAKQMNMTPEWVETSFQQMIASVQSGRTDMILSGFSDMPQRHALLDFMPYLLSGAQVLVLAGSSTSNAKDLCGQAVAASRATSFPAIIREWSRTNCEAQGRPAIIFYPSESGADARIQLLQGRVAAMVQGRETVGYFMSITHNAFRRLGAPLSHMILAIGFAKTSPALRDKVQLAFEHLKNDGTYARLLRKWSLENDAIVTTSDGSTP